MKALIRATRKSKPRMQLFTRLVENTPGIREPGRVSRKKEEEKVPTSHPPSITEGRDSEVYGRKPSTLVQIRT